GVEMFATPALQHFLKQRITHQNFEQSDEHLDWFTKLDDSDIMSALKVWTNHEDFVLSTLCKKLLGRELFRTEMRTTPFSLVELNEVKDQVKAHFGIADAELDYFVYEQTIQNSAYDAVKEPIRILNNKGDLLDSAEASDLSNLDALAKRVTKYALTYLKESGKKYNEHPELGALYLEKRYICKLMQFSAEQIANLLNGKVEGNPDAIVTQLSKIEEGSEGSLSFVSNPKYEHYLYSTQSSVVIIDDKLSLQKEVSPTIIRVPNAYSAFTQLLKVYQSYKTERSGREPGSYIHETAQIGEGGYIGAHAYLGKNVQVGSNVIIYPNVYIGDNVQIGDNCMLYPNVTIYYDCIIGANVVVHAGAVIG